MNSNLENNFLRTLKSTSVVLGPFFLILYMFSLNVVRKPERLPALSNAQEQTELRTWNEMK